VPSSAGLLILDILSLGPRYVEIIEQHVGTPILLMVDWPGTVLDPSSPAGSRPQLLRPLIPDRIEEALRRLEAGQ